MKVNKPISVLYIHHSGTFGGASRSLMEMIQAFPDIEVKAHLLTQRGDVSAIFMKRGISVIETLGLSQFDHTRYGYYRAFRWLILFREIFYLPFTALAIIKAKKKWKNIDIIHVNEVTNVVSIILSKLIFRCPIIIHVRSLQQNESCLYRRKLLAWTLGLAKRVLAIDLRVRNSLPQGLEVDIIHNGLNKMNKNETIKQYQKGSFLEKAMTIVFVGSLSKMKGIYEILESVKLCAKHKMNVKFLIVGEVVKQSKGPKTFILNKLGFTSDTYNFCKNFILDNKLETFVNFSGFTTEIESIYKSANVVCFPSHLNAVGRPVIEAALYGLPSIIAIESLPDDSFVHQQTGLHIKEKNCESLFDAIRYFYSKPAEIERMGANAYKLAQNEFNIRDNAKKVLDIYKHSLST